MVTNIIFAVATLVSVATFAVFLYTIMIFQKPLPKNSNELNSLVNDSKNSSYIDSFKVERLTINLENKSSKRLRFIDVEVHLVPFNGSSLDKIESNKYQAKDIIIDTLGSMSPEDLNTVSGKILAENRIKKKINQLLNPNNPIIKNIFFSVFVIQ